MYIFFSLLVCNRQHLLNSWKLNSNKLWDLFSSAFYVDIVVNIFQIAHGAAISGMPSWKKWLTRTFPVCTRNMVATSRHLHARPCWEGYCWCGAFGTQNMVIDKVSILYFWICMFPRSKLCVNHFSSNLRFCIWEEQWFSFKIWKIILNLSLLTIQSSTRFC